MMRGCVMDSSFLRASSFPKTTEASLFRSSAPSAWRTSAPKACTTSVSPELPFARTWRAMSSASITCRPRPLQWAATELFPEANPPVSPKRTNPTSPANLPPLTPPERHRVSRRGGFGYSGLQDADFRLEVGVAATASLTRPSPFRWCWLLSHGHAYDHGWRGTRFEVAFDPPRRLLHKG